MQTIEEKLSVINSIPPTQGVFGFEAMTKEIALKKSRETKVATPPRYQTIHKLFRGTVWMGGEYQAMVNRRREKEGTEPDFESKPTYCKPVGENRLIWENVKTGQLYLRVYLGYGSTMTSEIKFFDADMKEIPLEEYREVKRHYLKLDSTNENQELEEKIEVRNYKIENISRLKRGEEWL